ncbi:unnamed protein product [Durusdinium trenchii]|uniref:ABC1 atypical kinase-like domain-containing protein n=1 Tax=Durusdinium trenchii TaxID=1381693 RepID=A0ABP0JHL7_9DINO
MVSISSWKPLASNVPPTEIVTKHGTPKAEPKGRSSPAAGAAIVCAALLYHKQVDSWSSRSTRSLRSLRSSRRSKADVYDAAQVEAAALENPLAVFGRGMQVVSQLGRYYVVLKLDEALGRTGEEIVRERSRELRQLLLDLGPCYIKLGQALANRPDIIRDDYMAELEALQDKVPPFPSSEAMSIIQTELGQDPKQIFSEITAGPVAAASLGQVYRGRLRCNGEEVAVKVQRPGLKDSLILDMFIFRRLSELLNSWARRHLGCNVTLVVDEFASKLWEEANYYQEAQNAQKFAENFGQDPTVKIPKVFMQYVSKKVITMEWIDGLKSTDLSGLRRRGIDVNEFIRNGVQAALRQLLEFGLFHGDPHAGNIFAMNDGRMAYVDFGNVANISESQRDVLIGAITHVSNSDYKEIANDFIRLGFLRPGTDVSEIVPAMETIWADSMGKSIKDFNFRTVTGRFSKLVYQFPIRIPERFSLVIRSLLMQEGICMCLNPDFSIIEVALPYASKRLLSNPNPTLRRELLSIIFSGDDRPVLQWDRLANLVTLAKQARDGTSIQINQVIVDFFRGLRRDVMNGVETGFAPAKVLRGSLEALTAGDRLRLREPGFGQSGRAVMPGWQNQEADDLTNERFDDFSRPRHQEDEEGSAKEGCAAAGGASQSRSHACIGQRGCRCSHS